MVSLKIHMTYIVPPRLQHPGTQSTHPLMATGEKRRILLTVALLLFQPPPTIQLTQILYPTAEVALINSTSIITGATALTVTHLNQLMERHPRPQQGGCQITIEYLWGLSDSEAQWAFQCIPLSHITVDSNLISPA